MSVSTFDESAPFSPKLSPENCVLECYTRISALAKKDDSRTALVQTLARWRPYLYAVDWRKVRSVPEPQSPAHLQLLLLFFWHCGGPPAFDAFLKNQKSKTVAQKTLALFLRLPSRFLVDTLHQPWIIPGLDVESHERSATTAGSEFEISEPDLVFANYPYVMALALKSGLELTSPTFSALKLVYLASRNEIEAYTPQLKNDLRGLVDFSSDVDRAALEAVVSSLANPNCANLIHECASADFVAKLAALLAQTAQPQYLAIVDALCQARHTQLALDLLFRVDYLQAGLDSTPDPQTAPQPAQTAQPAQPARDVQNSLKTSQTNAEFVINHVGSDPRAYSALTALRMSPTTPVTLPVVSAIALLTLSAPDGVDVQGLQVQLLNDNPRLINFGQGFDSVILGNALQPAFPPSVETEMRGVFQRMYEQQLDIPDVVALLERLKRSPQAAEQDLFACMVHSLFDEYHFFPQYPVKALATTAVLFGSIAHFRLIDGLPLAVALRFVLDALRHPVDSNMFRFGLQALVEMRPRLPEFPKYCAALLQVPGLQAQPLFLSELQAFVVPGPQPWRAINPEAAALPADQPAPSLEFLVNNLTQKNLDTHAGDLAQEIVNLGVDRFAHVLVARALTEPNFHALYSDLLDALPRSIARVCVDTCIDACLLHAKTVLTTQDLVQPEPRMLLRNIGQFLGMITLARDRPILEQQLGFRLLLADAARRDALPAVLPFITKILAQTPASSVFAPSSPWVRAVLAVLSELYAFGGLKLTLKFEIEVLGQALDVRIEDLPPAVYIRDESRQHADAAMIAASVSGHAPAGFAGVPAPVQSPVQLQTRSLSGAAPAPTSLAPAVPGALPPGAAPGVPLAGTTDFVVHPVLRQLLDVARSKTLQDVLLPVVDRSVSIASCAAKELVAKDFVNDADDAKVQRAAHSLAASLAPAMSLVTAKDPFVEALAHNLRTLVVSYGFSEAPGLIDQIGLCARETLESLLPLVVSVAHERVLVEVDEALGPVFAARQQRRAAGQLPLKNAAVIPALSGLPRALSTAGAISEAQQRVYDRFSAPSVPENDLTELAAELQRLESLAGGSASKLADLQPESAILKSLAKVVQLAQTGARVSEEAPLRASQLVVQTLFGDASTAGVLLRECLCYALGELCRMSGITAKEVVLWLLYADDSKKHNASVIGTLLRSRLVTPAEIDASLAKDLADAEFRPPVVTFAAKLLLDALIGPEPYCLRSDFAGSLNVLASLDTVQFPAARILLQALQDTRGRGSGNEAHVFAEWTRLMQHHATARSPQLLAAFVQDLCAVGYFADAGQLHNLLSTAIAVSVQSYTQSRSFVGVDAVATLITSIAAAVETNAALVKSMLSTVVFALIKNPAELDPLPYFRLLSSVACTLPLAFVPLFGDAVIALNPLGLPAFASCWITLAAHRCVMGRMLADRALWPQLNTIVGCLLQLLREIWLSPKTEASMRGFTYKAVEKICLVILHDEPGFFLRYGNELSPLLVSEFMQLRNLLQAAFPPSQPLPNPASLAAFSAVDDDLAEAVQTAKTRIAALNILKFVECACRKQNVATAAATIATSITYASPQPDKGVDFEAADVSMNAANSVVVYAAVLAAGVPVEESGSAALLSKVLTLVSSSGRFFVVQSVVNQLRYAEKVTEFCVKYLLALFLPYGDKVLGSSANDVRHTVVRALLERLVAHRPHPWGVTACFLALLLDARYGLWELPFIKQIPEVASLFSTLAPVEVESN